MRVLGVEIPDSKKVSVALTYIFGVGPKVASDVLKATSIDGNQRVKSLRPEDVSKIQKFIEANFKVEGELRQHLKTNIARLKEINAYRGVRHSRNLPTHGQRTRRNTRTIRGNVRRTVGSGKRKVELK